MVHDILKCVLSGCLVSHKIYYFYVGTPLCIFKESTQGCDLLLNAIGFEDLCDSSLFALFDLFWIRIHWDALSLLVSLYFPVLTLSRHLLTSQFSLVEVVLKLTDFMSINFNTILKNQPSKTLRQQSKFPSTIDMYTFQELVHSNIYIYIRLTNRQQ